MKLSTNFTLFGLNVKAIQSYLKEQAKDRRGVRVTRRGDLVYVITAYTAFKLPAVLYPDVIQPVFAGHPHRQEEKRPCKAFPHRDNAHLDKCRL